MTSDAADTAAPLSPDEAFSVLGNETRLTILHTLAEADDRLSFSELRARVGMRDSGQFNYHLDQVVGHFVDQTEEGYTLRHPGKRVVQAVLSGAVTDEPVVEPTEIDHSCPFCDGACEASYSHGRVELYCTECGGLYGDKTRESIVATDRGHLGGITLPPAGVHDRSVDEVVQAATTWSHLELVALSCDMCPRCSALLSTSVAVCDAHDAATGLCAECGNRHAIHVESRCSNCFHEMRGVFGTYVMGHRDVLGFVADHGLNPISDGIEWGAEWGEEVISRDPFEARISTDIDDERVCITVGDDLSIVDVSRRPVP